MSNNNFRPLLPAGDVSMQRPGPSRSRDLVPKQPHVASACSQCRKSKSKCSGDKPQCARCAARSLNCEYDGDLFGIGLAELRRKYRDLMAQNEAMGKLLSHLASQPEQEAQNILRSLRTANDPREVLGLVMNGDIVMQQHTVSAIGDECNSINEIERAAMENSEIRVPARPWTGLAGDGVVSHLISSFMTFDQPFMFSFVDKDRFIEDMRAGSPKRAKYCSPFLVNAICSLRCHTSRIASAFNRVKSMNLRDSFLNEAKELLYLEAGRISLPTAQGLAIVFMCHAGMGKDRVGRMSRYMAYDMLKRLRLLRAQKEQDPFDEESMKWARAASRASWGFYCFESIVSIAYAQPSLVARPTCPRAFLTQRSSRWSDSEFDTSLVFDAMCDLSIIYNEAVSYNVAGNYKPGSEYDLIRRSQLLARIRDWRVGLSSDLQIQTDSPMTVYMLRTFEDQVIISTIKDLDADARMPLTGLVVKDINISCCIRSLESMNIFADACNAGLYSCFLIFPLYHISIALFHLHKCVMTSDLFSNACHYLTLRSKDFPFTAFLLEGLRILAERMNVEIPREAMPDFESLRLSDEELTDVPITFVIPDHEQVIKELKGNQEPSETSGVQLGAMITQWSQHSTR